MLCPWAERGTRSADAEGAVHDDLVRVALVDVATGAQLDLPRLRALEDDLGRLVDAGAGQVEVVVARAIEDADRVRARGEPPDEGAGRALERDREAGPDGCDEW